MGDEFAGKVPIQEPAQLKTMSSAQLTQLAARVRERLITVVAANGGHLAPNLGVVELTLALHRAFSSPRDRIVWDVGHQSYVHKLVTGRWDEFDTLRRSGGIAGFPRRSESAHDAFETGHASTSISAALGLAQARDLQGSRGHVVAVIGDGSLTGGMAFEALNHAGQARTRMLVVLNDNSMSIARSVGGMAAYLGRVRTHPLYSRTKEDLKGLLEMLPGGPSLSSALGRVRNSLKYLLIPGVLFEELGWTYLGPVDGHSFEQMDSVLRQAKGIAGPTIVHCLTDKGKGYRPAEINPNRFHGIGPFDPDSGHARQVAAVTADRTAAAALEVQPEPQPSYSDVFGRSLAELAADDPRICAITAAMPDGTGLREFMQRFPRRAFDVGIAEQHAVTLGAGLAAGGMRPVVAIYSTFLQRAYDQVLHDVCLQDLPVTFALDRAGLVGEDGPTHHGAFDLAYLRHMPRIVVSVPRDGPSLECLLRVALRHNGPFALRYPRGKVPRDVLAYDDDGAGTVGRGQLLRDGHQLAILAVGPLVYEALAAAELLSQHGLSVAVADARYVRPLDTELLLKLARLTGHVLTVEDGVASGGFGSAVLEELSRAQTRGLTQTVRTRVLGLPAEPLAHATVGEQLHACGLDAAGIAAAASDLVGRT